MANLTIAELVNYTNCPGFDIVCAQAKLTLIQSFEYFDRQARVQRFLIDS
jgi:hypothetical protein